MKKIKILIFICFLFLLTGCWNYNELNELVLITGVAIDKDENGFIMNYMIANSSKNDSKSNNSETGTILYEGKGETLSEAAININQKLPKIPYLSHAEIIVISDKVAETDMIKAMDFLLRNTESRKEIYVLISKDVQAKDTLSILTPLESFPSNNIRSNIISSAYEVSTTSTIKYSEFLSRLITTGIEPTLGIIEIEGDIKEGQDQESTNKSEPKAIIKLTDTAIFKSDKLVYITNEEESTAINTINKKFNNLYIKTQCDDNEIVTYLTEIDVKSDIKIENDTPKINIKLSGNGALLEVNCKRNLEDNKVIEAIQKEVENEATNLLYKGINVAKEHKTDIFGFGNMIYKKNPKYWKNIKEKWNDEVLPNIDIKIEAKIDLSSKGSLEQSIKEEIK